MTEHSAKDRDPRFEAFLGKARELQPEPPSVFEAGEFADALIEAAAELVGTRWRPDPPPTWMTCVPSTARPDVVAEFAERLVQRLVCRSARSS